MQKTLPYAGNAAVLALAKLLEGLTATQIRELVWEARIELAKDIRTKLEEIFDNKVAEIRDSGCSEEIIASYLEKKADRVKSMAVQCIHWKKEIPENPFIFKPDGEINHLEWYNPCGW